VASATAMRSLAPTLGCDHNGHLGAKVNAIMAGFRSQVEALAASHGVSDLQDMGAWARESGNEGALKEAQRVHGMQRSTRAYVPLMKAYLEALPTRPGGADAILNAKFPTPGTSAYKNQSGEIVLRTPNGEVSWRVAVRTGLVKPHRG
jgi:hypothetical protein